MRVLQKQFLREQGSSLPVRVEDGPAIGLEKITDANALEAFEKEWIELWEQCPAATPFQSPAWIISWWKHFGADGLWTLALRNGNELVGIAPLFIFQPEDSATRQLLLIGTGNSDYLDILAKP